MRQLQKQRQKQSISSKCLQMINNFRDWSQTLTLRLGFSNIGPNITNLEINLTNVTTIFLQYNKISVIDLDAFRCCPSLKFLALQNNLLENLPSLKYLKGLEFLDLSGNQLQELDAQLLPQNLFVLKLHGNPMTTKGATKFSYRK